MSQDSTQEKTEQPTHKRLEDARKEGQIVKSKELTSFFSLISIFTYFLFTYKYILGDFFELYDVIFSKIRENYTASANIAKLSSILKVMAVAGFKIIIIPVIIASTLTGFIAMVQAGGIIFTPKALQIKFDKFNIVTNAKNIFSMQTLKKFVKDMFQLAIMTFVAYIMVKRSIADILNASYYNLRILSLVFFKLIAEIFIYLLVIYLIFAIIDYILERMSFMKKMMMSLEEIKKELKDTELSPMVKQRQRDFHWELMEEESMNFTIKNSTMVITNPTHIAIVLLYDPEKIKLPAVMIKATDKSAEIVRKLAKKHNILMVRDVWLARQLYHLAEVKKYVPSSLIAPIADIIGKYLHLLPENIRNSFSKAALKNVAAQQEVVAAKGGTPVAPSSTTKDVSSVAPKIPTKKPGRIPGV